MSSNEVLEEWLERYGIEAELKPLTGDASLRKYYRIEESFHSGIIMDASAQPESVKPFVDIGHRLYEAEVRTPKVNAFDLEQGFVFMEDMGDRHFYDVIEEEGIHYYPQAIDTIVKMQYTDTDGLPDYDRDFLLAEMSLMQEWYLDKYLGLSLSPDQKTVLEETFEKIADVVLEQPQGFFVHRDFHSRNLMFDCSDKIVVIDFQDARAGAVTYDPVSLLRDVYVELDAAEVERLALYFRDIKGLDVDDETFMKWFDFTGLQRHIKILGIFARLALRDGKEWYLKDIPLTLKYIKEVGGKYLQTHALTALLDQFEL
ncbi:aminoglycoside phosphotransferase family protein [Sulfurovum sp. ST-21]|uniref:Phosphotransferase n=1 Tax=Sulfurovum indicum TaxID=2779528 RepID=A0A7M1S1Q6_9BACT|nr:phosphotransferase [Sulfurovum indicum]QOR61012.1 phosphotransferase [Sulfurovum indicum]